jgi:hypothetical protein
MWQYHDGFVHATSSTNQAKINCMELHGHQMFNIFSGARRVFYISSYCTSLHTLVIARAPLDKLYTFSKMSEGC